MDQSVASQNRRSRRSPVLLTAAIEVGGVPLPVKLRNLSEEGALIEGSPLPAEGTPTVFERKEMRLTGRIVWVQGNYAGVAFDTPLNREQALRHIPAPEPKRQQAVEFRRPGFTCRPLSDYERRNLERWLATAPRSRNSD
jgi:PilZ domain